MSLNHLTSNTNLILLNNNIENQTLASAWKFLTWFCLSYDAWSQVRKFYSINAVKRWNNTYMTQTNDSGYKRVKSPPYPPPGKWGLPNKVLCGKAPLWGPNPYSFINHTIVERKRKPFYHSWEKEFFHLPSVEMVHFFPKLFTWVFLNESVVGAAVLDILGRFYCLRDTFSFFQPVKSSYSFLYMYLWPEN